MPAVQRMRRAVVAVQVLVLLTVLVGAAALTIDLGAMFNTRGDLQRATDAGALAGASAYTSDEMMAVRMETAGASGMATVVGDAVARSTNYSYLNPTYGAAYTNIAVGDILTGWINPSSGSEAIHTSVTPKEFNAVQVTARRQDGSSNGAVELLFAGIFGKHEADVTAGATAIFDDRFAGVSVQQGGAKLLPFTIHENAFESELAEGSDQYGYDHGAETVTSGADGIREIRLYPYPLSGSGYEEGDGNFGVLNIGTGNQGVSEEVVQIENGVSPEDFIMEIGTAELTFVDQLAHATTYDMTGSPGLEATLKSALTGIVGQEVGFFLHNNVVLSGANATYTITQVRYGRVMAITLTGAPNQRGFFLQPTSYAGNDIIISEDAPSTGGLVGRLVIAR